MLLCGLLRYCPRLLQPYSPGAEEAPGKAFAPPLPPASARDSAGTGPLLGAMLAALAPMLELASPAAQLALLPSALQLMLRTIHVSGASSKFELSAFISSAFDE